MITRFLVNLVMNILGTGINILFVRPLDQMQSNVDVFSDGITAYMIRSANLCTSWPTGCVGRATRPSVYAFAACTGGPDSDIISVLGIGMGLFDQKNQ